MMILIHSEGYLLEELVEILVIMFVVNSLEFFVIVKENQLVMPVKSNVMIM